MIGAGLQAEDGSSRSLEQRALAVDSSKQLRAPLRASLKAAAQTLAERSLCLNLSGKEPKGSEDGKVFERFDFGIRAGIANHI
jgi:hypothetical protein